jgi:pilus assembly protein CpaE
VSIPRIAVVTPTTEGVLRLANVCGDLEGGLEQVWSASLIEDSPAVVAERLAASGVDVVVIGPDVAIPSAMAVARALDHDHPAISVIFIGEPTPAALEQAMRSGVRDVVSPSADDAELHASLRRALLAADRLRVQLGGADRQGTATSKVIVVLAPKGGTGKTTISTNLAVALAQRHPNRVVLVDFDLQFGDVANSLRLTPEHTIIDSLQSGVHLDGTTLKAYLTPHPSGMFVLCAPDEPVLAEKLAPDHLHTVLKLLAEEFPYVVIDTAAGIDDATLAAMDVATDVVLLTTTDVPSVHATRKQAAALVALQMTDRAWHVVLNRADARVGLDREDIERTIGLRIDVSVPSSRLVPISLNQGSPVLEAEPKSRVAHAMGDLANRFTKDEVLASPAPRRMRRRSRS